MKRLLSILFILAISTLALILFCDNKITVSAKEYLYSDIASAPYNKVGLVLGTSKHARGGGANLYFDRRVKAVVDLFQAKKISYIIVSGDNGTKEYNEPQDMKEALTAAGIPEEKIFLDYAGFRTFDSVIRANKIFSQTNFTIISQPFHNERAVFIARHEGLHAIGYNAEDVVGYNGIRAKLREKLARVDVFIDFLFGTQPKFLGEKITIE